MRRHYQHKRPLAENYLRIDVFGLNKCGFFREEETEKWCTWYNSDGEEMGRLYAVVSTAEDEMYVKFAHISPELCFDREWYYDYMVPLTTTPCYFGKVRYWFRCPSCHKRVGVLYQDIGGESFLCRHCNNLTYRSRYDSRYSRGANLQKRIAKLTKQIEDLKRTTKRRFYAGRRTKKQQRLHKLQRRLEDCLDIAKYDRFLRGKE